MYAAHLKLFTQLTSLKHVAAVLFNTLVMFHTELSFLAVSLSLIYLSGEITV